MMARLIVVFGALVVALMYVVGCAAGPLSDRRTPHSERTLNDQRATLAAAADAVASLTGPNIQWHSRGEHKFLWPDDAAAVFEAAYVPTCSFHMDRENPAAAELRLEAVAPYSSLEASAEQVRALWESEGWVLTYISRLEAGDPSTYFRADRADGSLMSFEAAPREDTGILILYLRTECSTHPTVMR